MSYYNNPALNKLEKYSRTGDTVATYSGIALKSIYFALLVLVSAAFSFVFAVDIISSGSFMLVLIGAPILAFIFAMIASFAPMTTPYTGTFYAVFEGIAVGFISAIFESAYSGVVFAALVSTFAVFLLMLALYWTGVIRVGTFFKKFMFSALLGILFSQLIIFIIGLFSPAIFNLFYGNGTLSIVISIVMVVVASLMILIDLNRMTEIVKGGLDKRYEWVAAFGLLVTLVWLYIEFLKLFSKIASRR